MKDAQRVFGYLARLGKGSVAVHFPFGLPEREIQYRCTTRCCTALASSTDISARFRPPTTAWHPAQPVRRSRIAGHGARPRRRHARGRSPTRIRRIAASRSSSCSRKSVGSEARGSKGITCSRVRTALRASWDSARSARSLESLGFASLLRLGASRLVGRPAVRPAFLNYSEMTER